MLMGLGEQAGLGDKQAAHESSLWPWKWKEFSRNGVNQRDTQCRVVTKSVNSGFTLPGLRSEVCHLVLGPRASN